MSLFTLAMAGYTERARARSRRKGACGDVSCRPCAPRARRRSPASQAVQLPVLTPAAAHSSAHVAQQMVHAPLATQVPTNKPPASGFASNSVQFPEFEPSLNEAAGSSPAQPDSSPPSQTQSDPFPDGDTRFGSLPHTPEAAAGVSCPKTSTSAATTATFAAAGILETPRLEAPRPKTTHGERERESFVELGLFFLPEKQNCLLEHRSFRFERK